MEVINKRDTIDASNEVYMGRGSSFGNPFPMRLYRNDRNFVVEAHKLLFLNRLANSSVIPKLIWDLPEDSKLVCYCHPESCHADIYKEFWDLKKEGFSKFKEARKEFLARHNYTFLPQREGIDHINIYSKSRTELGRLTSNFTHSPFVHPDLGDFASMEGFWFYVGTGFKHEELRKLHGYEAKKLGGSLEKVLIPDFEDWIYSGLEAKVECNDRLRELLSKNHLPFRHYYSYGKDNDFKCVNEGNGFLEKSFQKISLKYGDSYSLLIAGSRNFFDIREVVKQICASSIRIKEIVEGGAKGVDMIAAYYAAINHYPLKTFLVSKEEWEKSRGAGMKRNVEMGNYADKGMVFILNDSRGSTHMASHLQKLNKLIYKGSYENT